MEIHLTVEELVQYLKRSSLTTILVEGKDDTIIYRWIEEEVGISKVNFLPCGGRNNLLQVFERRSEFSQIRTVFIADQDAYVYSSPPARYSEIIWTAGYSVENDLYQGRRIEGIMTTREAEDFQKALENFIRYYGFEVEQLRNNNDYDLSVHPYHALLPTHDLNQDFLDIKGFVEPKQETIKYLLDDYDRLLRGKSLFGLLVRFLSAPQRAAKFSKMALCELCYRMANNGNIARIVSEVNRRIA